MPLARIITRSAEDARELSRQLRVRGFAVEIVSPEQIVDTSADLVIRLDECSISEALSNPGLFPDKNLPVFVAPGAIAGGRPFTQNPSVAQMEDQRLEQLPPENPVPTAQINNQSETPGVDGETRREPPAAQEPEVYVYQDAMLSPLQRLRLPRFRLARIRWPQLHWPRISMPRPSLRWPRLRIPRPELSFPLPRVGLRIPKPNFHLPRFSWHRPSFHWPRIKVRLPRPALHVPRVALRVPRVHWGIPRMRGATTKAASSWRNATTATSPESMDLSRVSRQPRSMRNITVFWDSAVAFGILAVCALMVGGLLHSQTPLPASLTQTENRGQRVPFAKVSAVSPSASANTHTPAIAAEEITTPPIAAPQIAAQTKPSPEIARHAAKLSRRSAGSHRPAGNVRLAQRSRSMEDGDYVADDVVIHYGKN
jgi:hypothetical protein